MMLESLPPCPDCGHNTLVRHGHDHIRCLKCPYQRNLAESPADFQGLGIFLGVCLLLLVVGMGTGAAAPARQDSAAGSCLLL
ncbi:MAG: hypothetical protein HC918_12850 [Oscillatoriales cyanobacterium SM2_1_8]|nr:hypothetical protein [Oscillatoriales cyanobacterium SM2_1_8]